MRTNQGRALQLGYYPQVVLAGRRLNDGMARWVLEQLVLVMARRSVVIAGALTHFACDFLLFIISCLVYSCLLT
jgi:hypothetical protein